VIKVMVSWFVMTLKVMTTHSKCSSGVSVHLVDNLV
jgi:hypothetical protein